MYYSFLTVASYSGAAFGRIFRKYFCRNGTDMCHVRLRARLLADSFSPKGQAWLYWVTLFFAMVAMVFGAAMPETCGREILRTRIRYNGSKAKLSCAQSGVTVPEMARITVLTPLKMLATEPPVITVSLYLGLKFAVVFQWFISVPAALIAAYNLDARQAGLALFSAVGRVVLALVSSCLTEALISKQGKPNQHGFHRESAHLCHVWIILGCRFSLLDWLHS